MGKVMEPDALHGAKKAPSDSWASRVQGMHHWMDGCFPTTGCRFALNKTPRVQLSLHFDDLVKKRSTVMHFAVAETIFRRQLTMMCSTPTFSHAALSCVVATRAAPTSLSGGSQVSTFAKWPTSNN